MNKELKAISLLYPGLIENAQLNLSLLLSLDTNIINDLMAKNDFYQLCKQGILDNPAEFTCDDLENLPIWSDKDILLALVAEYASHLDYASEGLKDDNEIVMTAMGTNGAFLDCASDRLRADKDTVMIAIKSCYLALEYASEELRSDKDCVNQQMISILNPNENHDGFVFDEWQPEHWDIKFLNDEAMVLKALEVSTKIGWDDKVELLISNFLNPSQEFIYGVINIDGSWIKYFADEFQADKKIVLAAVQNNVNAFQFASDELQKDLDIREAADKLLT